ncbi:hypothetical protein FACS1894208_02290 [Clostridia bacterium]|nr:hypothetical protein FACS1894208_02290 [Clostridia bacterium]
MEAAKTAQKVEVTFKKVIHLRDYENEEYSGTLTAAYSGALTPDENVAEMAKLQAELEYAVFHTLWTRKLITTHDFTQRKGLVLAQLTALGVEKAEEYLTGLNQ